MDQPARKTTGQPRRTPSRLPALPRLSTLPRLPVLPRLPDARAVAAHFRDLALLEREVLAVAGLNARGQVLCERRLQGHVTGVPATPRDLLPDVLRSGAVAAVLVHNHPSGRLVPSMADLHFTERFAAAADLCGIRLVDHVILAGGGWISLRASAAWWPG